MDYKVGIADGQSEGLQVLGLGEPLPIYLEGIVECTKEEVSLMPVKDGSTSKARLVDGGCISFENRKSGRYVEQQDNKRFPNKPREFHGIR